MKIIHTADICLDRCYAEQGLPAATGRANRVHLRECLEKILKRAQAWPADAVLITGNLLNGEAVERDTVAFLRNIFEDVAPIPILISPGRHDPYTPTSPYATELWPENVHFFRGPEWERYAVGTLAIYGFGHANRSLPKNPFESLHVSEEDSTCIFMGPALAASLVKGEYTTGAVVDPAVLADPRIAYVALGHLARATEIDTGAGPVTWYAGAPEGARFGDTGPHHYLEITIADEGETSQAVDVDPVVTSEGRFYEMTLDCTDLESGQALLDAIRPHLAAQPDRQCARIVLEGALLPAIYDEMSSIREALSEDVLYLDLIDRCFVAENYAALAEQKTSLGAFVARINQEIHDAPDEHRRAALCRSRDLALCGYRGQHLPIRASQGD